MKAILCRYYGPTDHKGSRITARAEGVASLTIPYPHEVSEGEPAHRMAAEALCKKHGWPGELAGGGLPNGDYVFCFIPKGYKRAAT